MTDLKQKFEGFGKDPSPMVWENISSELDAGKNHKKWWFFFGAILLFLGLGTGIFMSKDKNMDPKTKEIAAIYKEDKAKKLHENVILKEAAAAENVMVNNAHPKTQNLSVDADKSTVKVEQQDIQDNKRSYKEKLANASKFQTINVDANITNNQDPSDLANSTETDEENPSSLLSINSIHTNNVLNAPLESEEERKTHESKEYRLLELEQQFLGEIMFLNTIRPKAIKYKRRNLSLQVSPMDTCGFKGFDKRKWFFSLTYKHGLTNYDIRLRKTYRTIPQESFVFTPQSIITEESFTQYVSSSPFWIESLVKRRISERGLFVAGVEIGSRTNEVHIDDEMYYTNTNTSFGAVLGYEIQGIKTKRIILSAGASLFGEMSRNKSAYEPIELSYGGQLDMVQDNISQNEVNDKAIVAEINTTILIKTNNELGVHIKPFYKTNLNENHPSASFFDGGEHWGVGVGVSF